MQNDIANVRYWEAYQNGATEKLMITTHPKAVALWLRRLVHLTVFLTSNGLSA